MCDLLRSAQELRKWNAPRTMEAIVAPFRNRQDMPLAWPTTTMFCTGLTGTSKWPMLHSKHRNKLTAALRYMMLNASERQKGLFRN